MSVNSSSRYAGQPVLQVPDSNGVYHPTIYGPQPFIDTSFLHYTVTVGDRFDNLANQYLGDPSLWWQIADANPEIFYPDIALTPGSIIRIPVS